VNLHVAELHPDASETVLYLHGGNVAGWMWTEQAAALANHHALVPDLPGFGASAGRPWTDLMAVTDDLADLVRNRAHDGRAHVVGLSLGGVLGTLLAARHPDLVRSAFVTGAALRGVGRLTRWSGLAQVSFWSSPGYWNGLARAFRLPADSVDAFVSTGLGIDRDSARRMMTQVYDGVPAADLEGLRDLRAPMLAIAGEKEPRTVRRALDDIASRVPRAVARLAPGMHHVWSAEDPELFHDVLAHWLTTAEPSPALLPVEPAPRQEARDAGV
jgi:pimeloyl-ACP methyl ester carboxylesterase